MHIKLSDFLPLSQGDNESNWHNNALEMKVKFFDQKKTINKEKWVLLLLVIKISEKGRIIDN